MTILELFTIEPMPICCVKPRAAMDLIRALRDLRKELEAVGGNYKAALPILIDCAVALRTAPPTTCASFENWRILHLNKVTNDIAAVGARLNESNGPKVH